MGELNVRLDDTKLLEALSEMAARHGLPVETDSVELIGEMRDEWMRDLGC